MIKQYQNVERLELHVHHYSCALAIGIKPNEYLHVP